MDKVDVPVYQTFEREKLVCNFRLAYSGDRNIKIIQGAAVALI